MKRMITFLFLLYASLITKAQDIDVLHYKFVLNLNDNNDSINGLAEITFIKKTSEPTLRLDLVSVNKKGKGMYAYLITTTPKSSAQLSFSQAADKLIINAPQIKNADTTTIYIAYKGIPADGLIISKNKYGDRTFFADNWPNRAQHWIPCVDKPDDKASFTFLVAAPSKYSVISNGIKVEEKDDGYRKLTTWSEDTPQPTKVMVVGVARFATKTFNDSPKDIPISAWVYPQDSTKGFYDYALAPEIVKFFSNYIAPYPYKKLANVQSKTIFGGMENASAIFYAERSVTGDRSSEDLMAHEIAHQWFGDIASEKSFAHVWLSEGFATYFTNLYWEAKYGKEAMHERLKKDRQEVILFSKTSTHAVVDSTKDLLSLLNTNSYQKGGWILHMLRNEVGDTTFQKIIQAYYNGYKGSNADTRDFEAVAEKVSGKELTWFFDQWLYQPGISKLDVKWKHTDGNIQISIKRSGAFQQKIFLWLLTRYVNGTTARHRIEIKAGQTSTIFSYSENDEPMNIIIDPDTTLLFDGTVTKEK